MIAVDRLGVLVNPRKTSEAVSAVHTLLQEASRHSIQVTLEPWIADVLQVPALGAEDVTRDAQVLVVFGGDGTLLRAMPSAVEASIPLLGVNVGTMGFLAEIEPDGLPDALMRLSVGDYQLESRMLLSVLSPDGISRYALNDAVLSRAGYERLIRISIHRGETLIDTYLSDGMIVSTPTGSTAYSLSAGGPVVGPDMSCFILTPICPHTLGDRPMVFSSEVPLRLVISPQEGCSDERRKMQLSIDGQHHIAVDASQEIIVCKADRSVSFVRFASYPFFDLLREKLSQWSKA